MCVVKVCKNLIPGRMQSVWELDCFKVLQRVICYLTVYFPVGVIVFCCYVIVFFEKIGMIRYFPVPFLLRFLNNSIGI